MGSLRDEIIRFGEQMGEENSAAADLWSWLPSHAEAVEHHGDYWQSVQPSNADVMVEAASFIAALKLSHEQVTQAVDGADASEPGQYFACPTAFNEDDSSDAP